LFKIFPAFLNSEGQKVPLVKGWKDVASNDPAQIQLWSELFKERISFWAIPTGDTNGIVVLDIDVKRVNGFESLAKLGVTLPNTLMQRTPSGGAHYFFKTKPGETHPNTVNEELGLDTRGDRGWIAHYGFHDPNAPLADVPEWLYSAIKKPEKPTVQLGAATFTLAPEIAQGIFLGSLESIRTAAAGESNHVLNTEAFRVGQLVAAGSLSREYVEQELFKVAKERGKPDYEAQATIKSGLDGGMTNPMTCPFPAEEPKPTLEIPAFLPGQPTERWTPKRLTKYDLLNRHHLRRPQLFKDWSTCDIHIVTADGGTGKTTLALYEAVCLALGDRFLGFECLRPGKTLFITGEDTDKKLAAMLGAIMRQMGLFAPSDIPEVTAENEQKIDTILKSILIKKDADLCLIAKDRSGFLHLNPEAMIKVSEAIEDFEPDQIIFDPIASFWGSESMLNDMNKAVTKFMSQLVERTGCNVTMVNHMGKQSSSTKDMSQFAGRGGTGLPSHSRVSRVLRGLGADEYKQLTNEDLPENQSAMLCQVNKFSDGSPILNKPFLIVRDGYLFIKKTLSDAKIREEEEKVSDGEQVFDFIKAARKAGRYPNMTVVVAHFQTSSNRLSEARVKRAVGILQYTGHLGELVKSIDHPDASIGGKAFVLVNEDGVEL